MVPPESIKFIKASRAIFICCTTIFDYLHCCIICRSHSYGWKIIKKLVKGKCQGLDINYDLWVTKKMVNPPPAPTLTSLVEG